jgi:competence protein ComEC
VNATAARPAGLPPALEPRAALSDRQAVLLALVTWLAALSPRPVPLAIGAGAVVIAFAARRPWLLLVAAALLACGLAARSIDGLAPARAGPFTGTVTLVSDPEDDFGASVAEVRAEGHRFELRVRGSGRGTLRAQLAGERVRVEGSISPRPAHAPWMEVRHLVGRIESRSVQPAGAGSVPWRAANKLRRLLVDGAASLSPERRSLFTGLVLGDDRDQPPTIEDDFRGAGLSHLLAVSGENVAFVLAVAAPLLRRLRLIVRGGVTLGVLAFFALVTRGEPSVLRAAAMAALATVAFVTGRPGPALRHLSLAVSGLILVDPLLVRSVGFQLSVAASAGILLIAPPLRRALPGPALLVEPLSITAAAQLAVAPLLVTTFGGVPVASIPANLLAGPAAGLVMGWGLVGGVAAGLLGGAPARLLHVPTSLLIGWISWVARTASALPLGEVGLGHLAGIGVAIVVVGLGRSMGRRWLVRAGGLAAATVVLLPCVALRRPADGSEDVAPGVVLWRAGGAVVLVIDGAPAADRLLEGLRRVGLRRVDLAVLQGSGTGPPSAVATVRHRWEVVRVWAPAGSALPAATVLRGPRVVRIGGLVAAAEPRDGGLDVVVRIADRPELAGMSGPGQPVGSEGAARARGPPVRHHPPRPRDGHPQPHARLVLRRRQLLRLRRLPGPRRPTRRRGRRPARRGRRQGRPRSRGHRGGGARPGDPGHRSAARPGRRRAVVRHVAVGCRARRVRSRRGGGQ